MAKKVKKQASMLGIIMGIVILGLCAMTIAGICIDEWAVIKVDSIIGGGESAVSFKDFSDTLAELKDSGFDFSESDSLLPAMVGLGYLAVVIMACLTLAYLLKMVLNFGLMRFIVGIGGILTLAAGAALVGVAASYLSGGIDLGIVSGETTLGMGALFTSIGAIAGGTAAVVGVARK